MRFSVSHWSEVFDRPSPLQTICKPSVERAPVNSMKKASGDPRQERRAEHRAGRRAHAAARSHSDQIMRKFLKAFEVGQEIPIGAMGQGGRPRGTGVQHITIRRTCR